MVHEPGPHRVLAVNRFLPDREFRRCVARYEGDARLRGFSCWDQYLTMAFAQLTYRESLRDTEACLRAWARSYTTWASRARWRAPHWPTLMSLVTGVSFPTSPNS